MHTTARWRVALLALLAAPSLADAREPSIFEVVEGRWGLAGVDNCDDNAQSFSFSKDKKSMIVAYRRPIDSRIGQSQFFEYKVLGTAGNAIRMQLMGENQRTEDGETVLWDLVLTSEDSFCWHRADWPVGTCAAAEHRCDSDLAFKLDLYRSTTAQVLHLLAAGEYAAIAEMFELPKTTEPKAAREERKRIAKNLQLIADELGTPSGVVETDQEVPIAELAELSIGGFRQEVRRDSTWLRFLLFTTDYSRAGPGHFRVQFSGAGGVVQMTFSLPASHRDRIANLGATLLEVSPP